ncbi:hypothetical protein Cgig2_016923 [Carnegiea gigantea]|uniref:Uncharacterized protein n=1 Tax=Carnegiea gigantea TaxID=171969 RepID=A0A9Q1GND8_9CARY|nr:hypothetical protein Cgig2_016923 [Carnegiea gigantea]
MASSKSFGTYVKAIGRMDLDFNITLHLHYGEKFEEIDNFIQYVGETGYRQIEHDCDKLSLPKLGSILKEDCREMYAAECDEKDDQTRGVTKKTKSATHVTLQPLSKMGEKNTQQPLISIGSRTSNGKDQGSSNGKDQDEGGTSSPTMKRKRNPNARPRGMNLVKEVARLKDGEKLGVEFYNNGVVGDNSKAFSRHLGKLVRNRTICPIRVHSWDEI